MNLQKVVKDLHGAEEQTKVVALTLLLKLPGEQLVADQEVFRQLGFLANDGAQKSQGQLGDLFVQFRDRLETLRAQNENRVTGDGEPDLAALGRGDPDTQVATLGRIRAEKVTKALGELRALLEVGAVDRVVAAAVAALGEIGDPAQDLDRVRTYLGHSAGRVRAEAVRAFGRMAEGEAIIATLGPALGDRHPLVRRNAIGALGRVGQEAVVTKLQVLVAASEPQERARALPLLSYLRGESVLEMVRKLASDDSDSLRLDVVNILRAHGGKTVLSTLEWLAQDKHPRVQMFAKRSMMLLQAGRGQRPGLDVTQLDSVPEDPPETAPPPLDQGTPDQQVQGLMRIKRTGFLSAHPAVTKLLENEGNPPQVTASALSALAVLGGREDIARVRPYLAHMDGRVRANAVEAVDFMGGRKEILTWLTPLLADPIPRVKRNVLTALGRFGEAVFLGHLQRMIHSSHTPVRISGVYALAHYPGAAAKKLAGQVMQDKEAEVRINFAEALAGKSEAWTKEVLAEMAKSDMDYRVREAAQTSVEASAVGGKAERVGSTELEVGTGPAVQVPGPTKGGSEAPQAAPASKPAPPPAPAPAPVAAPAEGEPTYTMVDGLPMCPLPDEPPPGVKVARGVQGDAAGESGDKAEVQYHPSVDIPRDLVLGAAKEAAAASKAEAGEVAGTEAGDAALASEEAGVEVGEALVLESMTADAQDGTESGESSQDALGRTFMNFAALISPGKMATMKEVQKLEKERSAILEKMGRVVFEHIERGELKNSGFDRTLYVLKKYLHNMKKGGGKKPVEEGGWFGKLFGAGEGEGGVEEPPQLRAQFRNLAKDALELGKKGEVDLAGFQNHVRDVEAVDQKIQGLQQAEG